MDEKPDEKRLSRRRLISGVAGATLLGVAGGALAPVPVRTPAVPAAVDPDQPPEMDPLEESETPFAVWQYAATGRDEFRPTLPINVVFPLGRAHLQDVIDVFERANWVSHPAEYTRYAWDRERAEYRPSTWSGGESFHGAAGRLHVRCWELSGTVSMQTHIDTAAVPTHSIVSFARARAAIEGLFEDAGWEVREQGYLMGNDRGDHDGRATVIRAPEP